MEVPRVIALFRPGAPGEAMVALSEANLIVDWGIHGDRHARHGSQRQVLVVDEAALLRFALTPGDMDENIVVRGIVVDALVPGQRLRIGGVVLELTIPCPSCNKLEQIRPGLRTALHGQRGMFTRVIQGGGVRTGDSVEVVAIPNTEVAVGA